MYHEVFAPHIKIPLRKYFPAGYRIKNRGSLLRGQFSLRKHINGFNKDSFKVLIYYEQFCEDNGALFVPFPPHMAKTHTSKLRYRFHPRSGGAGLARRGFVCRSPRRPAARQMRSPRLLNLPTFSYVSIFPPQASYPL